MACLELRKNSKWWYGRWSANNHTYVKNLGLEVAGTRPSTSNGTGDRRFEQSRAKAQAKLEDLARQSKERRQAEELVQTLHQIRTGHKVNAILLTDMADTWERMPRRRHAGDAHISWARSVFKRFSDSLVASHPEVSEMSAVTPAIAAEFLAEEEKRRVSARTYNAELSLLKGGFRRLRREAGLIDNPFDDIPTKEEATVHRKPFTPEDLKAILDAVRDNDFCRPLVITGMCTAMRRGDTCRLRWADVDMTNRFITVKTSKTGARVQIPMFPMLHDELAKRTHASEFCFPDAAALYDSNPDGVNVRLKQAFEKAGFVDDDASPKGQNRPAEEQHSEDEIRQLALGRIAELTEKNYTAKVRETMVKVLEHYADGGTVTSIGRELGLSKGSVSTYLHRIERVANVPIVRRSKTIRPKVVRGAMHAEHEIGLRRVSQRGFHAFRATWVTLALTAGVPIELVRRVTGHATTQIVLDNYFQPGREQFRHALLAAMPALLTDGAPTRDAQMRNILNASSAETWQQDRERLLALLGDSEKAGG